MTRARFSVSGPPCDPRERYLLHMCPFCEQDSDIDTLLRLIKDEDLLVTLACDMAERVIYLTPDPGAADDSLRKARAWQDEPSALNFSHRAAEEARNGLRLVESIAAQNAVFHASGCAMAAVVGIRRQCVERATQAAMHARVARVEAEQSPVQEEAWQRAHIRVFACTCVRACPNDRSRISLLAH